MSDQIRKALSRSKKAFQKLQEAEGGDQIKEFGLVGIVSTGREIYEIDRAMAILDDPETDETPENSLEQQVKKKIAAPVLGHPSRTEELEISRLKSIVILLAREIDELRAPDEKLAYYKTRYEQLTGAVQSKFLDESRHETALRYIQEAEDRRASEKGDVDGGE